MSCVAPTSSADLDLGVVRAGSRSSSRGTSRAPGPVEAPIASRPRSTSASSCAPVPARARARRMRCARAITARPSGVGSALAAAAVDQRHAEALLERAHGLRDGRLRHAERLGGLGERPPLRDCAERGELTRIHRSGRRCRPSAARCRRGAGWRSWRARAPARPARRPRWRGAPRRPARSSSHSGEIGALRARISFSWCGALDVLAVLEEALVELLARPDARDRHLDVALGLEAGEADHVVREVDDPAPGRPCRARTRHRRGRRRPPGRSAARPRGSS